MLVLRVDFVEGRYHATPWDSHPNEGKVEWPPCPWRIQRALISGFHAIQRDPQEFISKLPLPSYYVPECSFGHTRHYMPPKDLIFDAFAAVEQPLYILYDVELSKEERRLLKRHKSRFLSRPRTFPQIGFPPKKAIVISW